MILIKTIPSDSCFYVTEHTGGKAELIAAGVASDAMFPAGRKRIRYAAESERSFHGYHSWKTYRVKGGKFLVRVVRRREAPQRPAPWRTEAEFRQHAAVLAAAMSATLLQRVSGEAEKDGGDAIGYRYSRDCLQRLAALFEETETLLAGGEIECLRPGKVVCFPGKA